MHIIALREAYFVNILFLYNQLPRFNSFSRT